MSWTFHTNLCVNGKFRDREDSVLGEMGLGDGHPDAIVLQAGLWEVRDRNLHDCEEVLPRLFALLKARFPSSVIVVVPAGMSETKGESFVITFRLSKMRMLLEQLSLDSGFVFVDMFGILSAIKHWYLVKVGNNVHYPISVLLDVANAIFNALL
jgi:hypothetical protein